MDDVEELKDQIAALEATLAGATGSVTAFEGELARMQESMVFTSREAGTLSTSIGGGLRNAFDGLVFEGMKLSDALTEVAQDILDTVYDVAMKPVQGALGGFLGNGLNSLLGGFMPFAKGGVISEGRVTPFAKGGIVSEPTGFAMRGGRGLMGEAGPEAIMPLARGPDGRLGVQGGSGGRPVSIVMNIQTPDVEGFRRSQAQVAAEASRAISRGQRNR